MNINAINNTLTAFQAKKVSNIRVIGELSDNVAKALEGFKADFEGLAKENNTVITLAQSDGAVKVNAGPITSIIKDAEKDPYKELWYGVNANVNANRDAKRGNLQAGLNFLA